MKHPLKVLLTLLLLQGLIQNACGQNEKHQSKKVNYSKDPHWIQMMDDPNVNYHEAVKAFEEFWEERGEPEKEGPAIHLLYLLQVRLTMLRSQHHQLFH